jgi:hypothetical protein
MASVDTQYFIDGLKAYFAKPEIVAMVNEIIHGPFKIGKIAKVGALAVECIHVVEQIAADVDAVGVGGAKRDAVVQFLDDTIKVPFYLEPIDGMIIGIGIDALVAWYNLKIGKGWLAVIQKLL